MNIDSSYAILMGTIIAVLGAVYSIASLVKHRKRQIERETLKSFIQAREKGAEPEPSAPPAADLPTAFPIAAASPRPVPVVNPAPPKPRPRALIAWVPPVLSEGPPRFNQYITWPGTKTATPVAERAPTAQDYVWD